MKTRNIQVPLRDGVMGAHLAIPDRAPAGAIVAIMEIVREGYPDATAFDRKDDHYDPDSDPKAPRWYVVDVRLKRPLKRTITLAVLRAHAGKELKGMPLLRPGNRLSITPVEAAHWKFILSLE